MAPAKTDAEKAFEEDLKAAKAAVLKKLEEDLVGHYRQRDRNEAWWRQVHPNVVYCLLD